MSIIVNRLQYWAKVQPNHIAIVMDDTEYTYAMLWHMVKASVTDGYILKSNAVASDASMTVIDSNTDISVKPHLEMENGVHLIESEYLLEQCVAWLSDLAQGIYPLVCHKDLSQERREAIIDTCTRSDYIISEKANFGVLTSGTTGTPKILWRSEQSWADFFDEQNKVFHIDKDTSMFVHGSFSFTGNMNMIIGVLWAGGTIVSTDSIMDRKWIQLMRNRAVSHVYMLPTKLRMILRHYKETLDSVQYIIAGSQTLDQELLENLKIAFPQMQFIVYYGASELNYITWCTDEEWLKHPGTVGKPFDGVQIVERDGLIYVDTPYGIEGIERPFTVHDRGYITDEGFLMFQGRQGEVINRGGYKLYINEIEQAIQELNSVDQVVVIGIPDLLRGEEMVCYVVPKPTAPEEVVKQDIHGRLIPAERPKEIIYVSEIPLTDCAKVNKNLLKEWYNKK